MHQTCRSAHGDRWPSRLPQPLREDTRGALVRTGVCVGFTATVFAICTVGSTLCAQICSAPKAAGQYRWLKSIELEHLDGIHHPCFIGRNVQLNKFTLRESATSIDKG